MQQHLVAERAVVRESGPLCEDTACRRMKQQLVAERAVVRVAGPLCEDSTCRRMKQHFVATRAAFPPLSGPTMVI